MAQLKKFALFIMVLAVVSAMLVFYYKRNPLSGEDYSVPVENIAKNLKEPKVLDLTDFQKGKWDELTIWPVYSEIEDVQVELPAFIDRHKVNLDEGSNMLIFLKENKIVGWARFPRRYADFHADFKNRIRSQDAIFTLSKQEDFPVASPIRK